MRGIILILAWRGAEKGGFALHDESATFNGAEAAKLRMMPVPEGCILNPATDAKHLVESAVAEFMRVDPSDTGDRLLVPRWQGSEWARLFSRATPLRLQPGEVLIQQSDQDCGLFFVVSGKLQVAATSHANSSVTAITSISPGSVVGELAFFDRGPRSAKVWAVTPTSLLKLTLSNYESYSRDYPAEAAQFLFAMTRLLSVRVRSTTARLYY